MFLFHIWGSAGFCNAQLSHRRRRFPGLCGQQTLFWRVVDDEGVAGTSVQCPAGRTILRSTLVDKVCSVDRLLGGMKCPLENICPSSLILSMFTWVFLPHFTGPRSCAPQLCYLQHRIIHAFSPDKHFCYVCIILVLSVSTLPVLAKREAVWTHQEPSTSPISLGWAHICFCTSGTVRGPWWECLLVDVDTHLLDCTHLSPSVTPRMCPCCPGDGKPL